MTPSFLEDLAQARPNPGGGAAAAYGAELGLALLMKVIRLELQRPSQEAGPIKFWGAHLAEARRLSRALSQLRHEDGRAYLEMARVRASGEPPETLAAAVERAMLVPRRIMEKAREALALVALTGKACKKHLISDLQVAGELLGAAIAGACHIARANLPLVAHTDRRGALDRELSQAAQQGQVSYRQVKEELAERRF